MKYAPALAALTLLAALTAAGCGTASQPATHPASQGPHPSSAAAMPPGSSSPATAGAPAPAAAGMITIKSFAYTVPAHVSPGEKITVRNEDSTAHTVTADAGSAFNVNVPPMGTATFTPRQTGQLPVPLHLSRQHARKAGRLMTAGTAPTARWAARALITACLATDAFIHLKLASARPPASPGGISQGALFYAEGSVAILAALLVVLRGTRATFAFAFLVAASALAAVLIYRYIDAGALGPLPDMYEPAWYTTKIITTIAEAIALPAAIAGLLTTRQGQAPGAQTSRASRDPDRSIR